MEMKPVNFSPVHLRTRKNKDGRESLYLDINYKGERSRERLELYLLPSTTRGARDLNRNTLRLAEEIRAKRVLQLQAEEYDLTIVNAGCQPVLEWLEEQRKYYHDHGNTNYSKTIKSLIRHLAIFGKKGMRMKDITTRFLRKFLEYLNGDINTHSGGKH